MRNSVDTGDFATYVERDLFGGKAPPGAVVPPPSSMHEAADFVDGLKYRPRKRVAGWFLSILAAAVFAGMAYLALTQDRIVLGGKRGDGVFEGAGATVIGFALLAVACFSLWQLAVGSRASRPIGLAFAVLWLLCLGWFFVAR